MNLDIFELYAQDRPKPLIEKYTSLFKGNDDTRASKLEHSNLFALFNLRTFLSKVIVELHCPNSCCPNCYKQNLPECLCRYTRATSSITRQNIHIRPQSNRVDVVVFSRNLLPPDKCALNWGMVAMIILRREAKTCHSTVTPYL